MLVRKFNGFLRNESFIKLIAKVNKIISYKKISPLQSPKSIPVEMTMGDCSLIKKTILPTQHLEINN
ncbi:hypothetical protein CYJ34_08010 [Anaerococcus octavius]|uniref:Uncharacterized protein n=1 Tax=Anaerococcus octavius TaxID=54007 RepID=A0A2I1M515_9FIRM|nr:hypothetical protein CYJ34_08010 [Anaerococcus octavius]